MINKKIAEIFDEIANMLSIEETPSSKFEVRAYKEAALAIGSMQEDLEDIYKRGGVPALMEIPGVGKGLAGKIEELIKKGKIAKYEELKKKYPIDFKTLTQIEGLGPKKIAMLYKQLGVKDLETLKRAINKHTIRELPSFGERSEEKLKEGVGFLESSKGRLRLGDALPEAESIIERLKKSGLVEEAIIAGSARRMKETVGDLDILAISKREKEVMDFFVGMKEVEQALVKGPTKTTVRLNIGITCDLRVIEPKSFGAAVQYFTGSKDHNIKVRTIAIKKGYKLNEYGLFDRHGKLITSRSEDVIYGKLGMQIMPPEMREDRGEVELALQHKIPKLIELADLKGDLHTHTKEAGGANSMDEMARAAIAMGLDYIALTNHTKSLKISNGLNDKSFLKIFEGIEKLNERLDGKFTMLKGAEVDILKNGSLDLEKKTLERMDCAVGAVHSNFNMSKQEMTRRVINAMDSGLLRVLAHPTGRVINEREPYQIDLERVIEAAERNNIALEINSFPERLDLSDTNIMLASKYKVMFAIDSDGHNISHFKFLRYGIGTARRGWLQKDRVINAMGLEKLTAWLER